MTEPNRQKPRRKNGVLGPEIAARNRKSLATLHRTLKSQCSIAFSCLGSRCDFWGPRWASQSQIVKIAAISVCQVVGPLKGPTKSERKKRTNRGVPENSGNQRAANGGSDPSWLNFGVFGAPRFSVQRSPEPFKNSFFFVWISGLKIGAPQKRQSYHDGSDPPSCGPLRKSQMDNAGRTSAKWDAPDPHIFQPPHLPDLEKPKRNICAECGSHFMTKTRDPKRQRQGQVCATSCVL